MGKKIVHHLDDVVEVDFDLVEIAVIAVGDGRWDVPLGDPIDILCCNIERTDNRVETIIDALDDIFEVALMFGCIGAGGKFTFYSSFREHFCVDNKGINGVDTDVEVVFDLVEIAIITVGNFRWNIALGDSIDIFGCNIERSDNRVETIIDALDDIFEVALMFGGIGTGGKFTIYSGFREHFCVDNKGINGINTNVEVVFDLVEVAVIAVGNLRRDVALGDPIDIFGGHIKRSYNRIKTVINADDDFLIIPLVFRGIGTGGKFTFHCRLRQHACIGHQSADGVHHFFHRRHDTGGIAGSKSNFPGQITNANQICDLAHLFRVGAQLFQDNAGDKETEADGNQGAEYGQDGHNGAGSIGENSVFV